MTGSTHNAVFDPYAAWLGIEAAQQPPTYYQLLEIEPFESRSDVIASAAARQIEFVETKKSGIYETHARKLLDELATARSCLLNPAARLAYDAALRQPAVQPVLPATNAAAYAPPALAQAMPTPPVAQAVMAAPALLPTTYVNPYRPVPVEQPAAPIPVEQPDETSASPAAGPSSVPRKAKRAPNPVWTGVSIVLGGVTGISIALVIANYVNEWRQQQADNTAQSQPTQRRQVVVVSPPSRPSVRMPGSTTVRPPNETPSLPIPGESVESPFVEENTSRPPPEQKPDDFLGVETSVARPTPRSTRPQPNATVDELLARLQIATTSQQRVDAIEQLGALGARAESAQPALTAALKDSSPNVRASAIQTLGKIGPAAKDAVDLLANTVDTETNDDVRGAAVRAMIEIDPDSAHLQRILRKALLGDTGSKVKYAPSGQINENRRWACGAVAKLGPKAEWALVLLDDILDQAARDLDQGENLNTFLAAAEAAKGIGKRDPKIMISLKAYKQGKALHGSSSKVSRARKAADETHQVLEAAAPPTP